MNESKKVAIMALMGALVGILEIFPIIGITDIPFPFYPKLTLDITGVPIMITYFLIGVFPALTVIAMVGIFIGYRNIYGSIFKVLAELVTLIGFALIYKFCKNQKSIYTRYGFAIIAGIGLRVIIMHIANYFLLPLFYGMELNIVVGLLPFIDIFNSIQGLINIGFALTVYKILDKSGIHKML